MSKPISLRLEQYTIKRPQEVLLVKVETATGESDMVMIYNGFSSSLMGATAYDPDIAIIAPDSRIISIDRLAGPYNPSNPQYLAAELTLEAMETILSEMNI
ncbi:MAG: hypothetical protein ACFCU5_11830 [Pleurocapsa sp.]